MDLLKRLRQVEAHGEGEAGKVEQMETISVENEPDHTSVFHDINTRPSPLIPEGNQNRLGQMPILCIVSLFP